MRATATRIGSTAIALGLLSALVAATPAAAAGTPTYDSIPVTLPPSYASLGFQATSTAEFGDHITLAGTDRVLESIAVSLTSWACESDFTFSGGTWTPAGGACVTTPGSSFEHPITVTVYAADLTGPTPAVGAVLATVTQTVDVPFRPSANPGVGAGLCGAGATQWFNPSTGTCHNGFAFVEQFDFTTAATVVRDDIIIGVSYNTQSYGPAPLGVAGPYNSLNVSLSSVAPTTGTDADAAALFWNTTQASFYADGGAGGTGTFRHDAGWSAFRGLVIEVVTALDFPTLALPDVTPAGQLPATGASVSTTVAPLGLAALLIGAGTLLLLRRRARPAPSPR